MTEIAELVSVVVGMDDKHDKNTCPWHEEEQQDPDEGELDVAHIEEDVEELQKNDGGKLGDSMAADSGGSKRWPENMKVKVGYKKDRTETTTVKVKGEDKEKEVAVYVKDEDTEYDVVFAAHHCVPGNAALKEHEIVRWLGADSKIEKGEPPGASHIKPDQFTGYNINNEENGIWLPGPYALSTNKAWPNKTLMNKVKREENMSADEVKASTDFKTAYAFAVIDDTDDACKEAGIKGDELEYVGRQYHHTHPSYSDRASDCLTQLDEKLRVICAPNCPEISDEDKADEKYDAPYGIVQRLNAISRRLGSRLKGKPWNKHVYTDKLSLDYIKAQGLGE